MAAENRPDKILDYQVDFPERIPDQVVQGTQMTRDEWDAYSASILDAAKMNPELIAVEVDSVAQWPLAESLAVEAAARKIPFQIFKPIDEMSEQEIALFPKQIDQMLEQRSLLVQPMSIAAEDNAPIHDRQQRYSRLIEPINKTNQAKTENRLASVTVPCPTAAWGKIVYPELEIDEAERKLSQLFFRAAGAEKGKTWIVENQKILEARAEWISSKFKGFKIETGNSQIEIETARKAKTVTATNTTKAGDQVYVNVPSYEIFTTPDKDSCQGKIITTRALVLTADLVLPAGLEIVFQKGQAVDFDHPQIEKNSVLFQTLPEIFNAKIGLDRIGSLGLVSSDNPLADAEIDFYDPLLNSQTGVNFVIGAAFKNMTGGENVNHSELGVVAAFGSEETIVHGLEKGGSSTILIENGCWQI